MNINKYTGYFHDGTVHDIDHSNNKMEISMESAEILSEWNKDNIPLSKHSRISGKLHLEEIKSIRINDKIYNGKLKKTYDSSDVYDFEIQKNKVILLISWINYPPKPPEKTDIFTIEIEVGRIYWENSPTLFDSYKVRYEYLDSNGNPVPKGSDTSHLYPPEGVQWE